MSRNKDYIYQVRYSEDALDGDTVDIDSLVDGEPCVQCGKGTNDGVVYNCPNVDCPCENEIEDSLDYNQELNFHDE